MLAVRVRFGRQSQQLGARESTPGAVVESYPEGEVSDRESVDRAATGMELHSIADAEGARAGPAGPIVPAKIAVNETIGQIDYGGCTPFGR